MSIHIDIKVCVNANKLDSAKFCPSHSVNKWQWRPTMQSWTIHRLRSTPPLINAHAVCIITTVYFWWSFIMSWIFALTTCHFYLPCFCCTLMLAGVCLCFHMSLSELLQFYWIICSHMWLQLVPLWLKKKRKKRKWDKLLWFVYCDCSQRRQHTFNCQNLDCFSTKQTRMQQRRTLRSSST